MKNNKKEVRFRIKRTILEVYEVMALTRADAIEKSSLIEEPDSMVVTLKKVTALKVK